MDPQRRLALAAGLAAACAIASPHAAAQAPKAQAHETSIDGVTAVDVDLASGRLTVTSDTPVDPDAVRSAVEEAGYEVVT